MTPPVSLLSLKAQPFLCRLLQPPEQLLAAALQHNDVYTAKCVLATAESAAAVAAAVAAAAVAAGAAAVAAVAAAFAAAAAAGAAAKATAVFAATKVAAASNQDYCC